MATVRHFRRAWSCRVCGFVYLRRRDCRAHWQRGHEPNMADEAIRSFWRRVLPDMGSRT